MAHTPPYCDTCRVNSAVVCIGDEVQCSKCAMGIGHESQFQAQIYDSAVRAFVTPQDERHMPLQLANNMLRSEMSAQYGADVYNKFSDAMSSQLLKTSINSAQNNMVPPDSKRVNYDALKQMTMHAFARYQQDPNSVQVVSSSIAGAVAQAGAHGESDAPWDGAGKWMAHAYYNFKPDAISADLDWLSPSRRSATRIAQALAHGTLVMSSDSKSDMAAGGQSLGTVNVGLVALRGQLTNRVDDAMKGAAVMQASKRMSAASFTNLMQKCVARIINNLDLPQPQQRKHVKVDYNAVGKLTAELKILLTDAANYTKEDRLPKRFMVVHAKLVRIFGAMDIRLVGKSAPLAFYVVLMLLAELARGYSKASGATNAAASASADTVMNYGVAEYKAMLARNPDAAKQIALIGGLGDTLRSAVRRISEKTATTVAPYPLDKMKATFAHDLYVIHRAALSGADASETVTYSATVVRKELEYDMANRMTAADAMLKDLAAKEFKDSGQKKGSSTTPATVFANAYRKYIPLGGSPYAMAFWMSTLLTGYIALTSAGGAGESEAQIKYRAKAVADMEKVYAYGVDALCDVTTRATAIIYAKLYFSTIFQQLAV